MPGPELQAAQAREGLRGEGGRELGHVFGKSRETLDVGSVYYRCRRIVQELEMDKEYTDKVIKLIANDLLSLLQLTKWLVEYAATNRTQLARILSTLKPNTVQQVWECLMEVYPISEFGWSVLPLTRNAFSSCNIGSQDQADLGKMLYQEDRPHVEYLRDVLGSIIGSTWRR
jgi:hypothetical protein